MPTRRAIPLLAAALLAFLPSCGLRPKSDSRSAQRAQTPVYPFTPARLAIHPLTRVVTDARAGGTRIEAHIEMLDSAGDDSKGWGELLIELYRESGPVEGVGASEQIMRWTINLSDLQRNTEAYDRVTRTYRLTLRGMPAGLRPADPLILRALLITPDGRQINASRRITT